jgi:hypothetical protein
VLEILLIFVSQFGLVFLLGFQSINVVRGYYVRAFFTSMMLGVFGWFTITILSNMNTFDFLTLTFFVYILAGPLAIISAMKTHELLK